MVYLNKAQNTIRNNYRPKVVIEKPIQNEQDAANKIDDSYFLYILQNETQHDENRGAITYKIRNLGVHNRFFGKQT